MHRHFLAAATLLFVMTDSRADDNCASIRAGIEAKIRAAGTANFSLRTVATDDRVAGRTVGSCDRGAKKIVYVRGAASAPTPQAPHTRDGIVTECRDGSVRVGGDCSK